MMISIDLRITTSGTENITDTRDYFTFNQKAISSSVTMSW